MRPLLFSFTVLPAAAELCQSPPEEDSSLMQALLPGRQQSLSKAEDSIDNLLQTAKDMSKSLTKTSFNTTDPDSRATYQLSIEAAKVSLQNIKTGLTSEHELGQETVNTQHGEIIACRNHPGHGVSAVSQLLQAEQSASSAWDLCNTQLTTAAESQTSLCEVWSNLANTLSSNQPPCRSTHEDAEAFYDHIQEWKTWIDAEEDGIASKRTACNDASTDSSTKRDECDELASSYQVAFCQHALACALTDECQRHETEIWNEETEPDAREAMSARQHTFQVVTQVECLLDLTTVAIDTDDPITQEELQDCDGISADVSHLTINFASIPAREGCPLIAEDAPGCPELAQITDWTAGQYTTAEGSTPPTGESATAGPSLDLTACGAAGRQGPSSSQCADAYAGTSAASVEVPHQGFQVVTAPFDAHMTIEASGARGGNNGARLGGYGATATARLTVNAGERIIVAVGQQGWDNPDNADYGGGGGGATWVAKVVTSGADELSPFGENIELLAVAGGGSGQNDDYQCHREHDEQTEGGQGIGGNPDHRSRGDGNGGGGSYRADGWQHAQSFLNGAMGGEGRDGRWGGFGGGGRPHNGGGGGGGYQGGDCNIRHDNRGWDDCRCEGGTSFGDSAVPNDNSGDDGSVRLSFTPL